MHVFAAHIALLALVGLTPLLLFVDSLLVESIVELYIAIALTIVALSIHPGEARHWVKTVRWAAALAALPLLWLIIQLLPLPIGTVSGSIWQSAASALGAPLSSHHDRFRPDASGALPLYIDSCYRIYCSCGVDRSPTGREAPFVLGAATIVISLISIVLHLADVGVEAERSARAAVAGSVYGVVLFATIIILLAERHLTRKASRNLAGNSSFHWWRRLRPLGLCIGHDGCRI